MTYSEALQYLTSFINYEKLDSYDYNKSFKLDRMRALAHLLGDPQRGVRAIHIAGSKGKGSTAAITYSILKEAGFKVGLYTSPHLISFRERIRINEHLISEDDIARLSEIVKKGVDCLDPLDPPTFFEVYTAIAYLYFKEKKVDFAVYEVGLGGRLDATNIIDPLVCAITPISYEHTQKLGNTLDKIASEKAGIIKDGVICVSAPQDDETLKVIRDVCGKRNSRLILMGRDIKFREIESSENGVMFSVDGLFGIYSSLKLNLLGSHQMMNAATAIGIIESLRFRGVRIGPDAVTQGIETAQWGGRLEIAGRNPLIILDGAHNRASARTAAESVRKLFKYKTLILVLGVSKDKDIEGIIEELRPITDLAILTKSKIAERALEPSVIEEIMRNAGKDDAALTSSVEEAIRLAMTTAKPDDLILVTGSLFVVGEVKAFLESPMCARTVGASDAPS